MLEIHHVLKKADVPSPYVLVGLSIGGLIGRLYTREYPEEVAGMVIVDHAFIDVGTDASRTPPVSSRMRPAESSSRSTLAETVDTPPVLTYAAPINLDLPDDESFSKLPELNRDLHRWAMSLKPAWPSVESAAECFAAVENSEQQPYPLDNRPLIVIRANDRVPGYEQLQAKLVLLSRNSKQVRAANSSHMVIIDEPEVVTDSIREVAEAVRDHIALRP